MMKSIAIRAARRAVLLRSTTAASRRMAVRAFGAAVQEHDQKFTSAHVDAEVPASDYYKGHLMADHLEYLDDVLEKTVELEESMQELRDAHEKKHAAFNNIGWTTTAEMDELFQDAAAKKEAMQQQLDELKKMVVEAKRTFAVDGPDGMPDGRQLEEIQEIEHIIEEAAAHEDGAAIMLEREENLKVLGVDDPSGMPDAINYEEMREIQHILEEAAAHEDGAAIMRQRAADAENRKVLGVDAPDGQPDYADYEDLKQANQIIEKAAELKDVILRLREMDSENRKFIGVDAPDGSPDSLNQEELLAIKFIIDQSAKRGRQGKN